MCHCVTTCYALCLADIQDNDKTGSRCVSQKFQTTVSRTCIWQHRCLLTRLTGIFDGYTEIGFVFITRLSEDTFQCIPHEFVYRNAFISSFTRINFASKKFMVSGALIWSSLAFWLRANSTFSWQIKLNLLTCNQFRQSKNRACHGSQQGAWGRMPPPWNLKMMTSYVVPLKITPNFSLAPASLALNTPKYRLKRRKIAIIFHFLPPAREKPTIFFLFNCVKCP